MNTITKLLLLVITLLTITLPSIAQHTLLGFVKDETNTPVINASIKVVSASQTKAIVSDINGYFELKDLTQNNYTLIISSIGYESLEQPIVLNQAKQKLTFVLKTTAITLQDVEVVGRSRKDYNSDYSFSATKIAIKNKELPQALSTVTKELIADRGAFQLADAVKIASGVSPSSFYNQYNIRGISQNEEGQIINGMRTRQYYFLQPLTSNIERVEVLKGPASVTFSSVDPGVGCGIMPCNKWAMMRPQM